MIVLDTGAAWALYILLKPVNQSLAQLTAWFREVFAAIFGIAVLNLLLAPELVGGEGYFTVVEPNQAQVQMLFFLNASTNGWLIGLVFFWFALGRAQVLGSQVRLHSPGVGHQIGPAAHRLGATGDIRTVRLGNVLRRSLHREIDERLNESVSLGNATHDELLRRDPCRSQ